MYRTGRVGYVQSILNQQTDKFFSRFVVDGGIYAVKVDKKSKEYIQLVNGIEDDSGLTVQEILGENEDGSKRATPKLDNLLNLYNKAFDGKLTGEAQTKAEINLYKFMSKGSYRVGKNRFELESLKGSLWQQLSSLEGINDVRNPTNGTVNTRFQTKPDATGSGIVLQLLQMIGYDVSDTGAKEKLSRLGLLGKAPDDLIRDVYGFLEKAIERVLEIWHECYEELLKLDIPLERLDSKDIRDVVPDIGFSREDRNRHMHRIGHLIKTLQHNSISTVASFVSPYRESRKAIREMVKNNIVVYIKADIQNSLQSETLNNVAQQIIDGQIRLCDPPLNSDFVINGQDGQQNK